jgi:hypothetical protein
MLVIAGQSLPRERGLSCPYLRTTNRHCHSRESGSNRLEVSSRMEESMDASQYLEVLATSFSNKTTPKDPKISKSPLYRMLPRLLKVELNF